MNLAKTDEIKMTVKWVGTQKTLTEIIITHILTAWLANNPAIIEVSGGASGKSDCESLALLQAVCRIANIAPIDAQTISSEVWEFRHSRRVYKQTSGPSMRVSPRSRRA